MSRRPGLALPAPPPDRGRLLTAAAVAELLGGARSPAWVRRHVPNKIRLGQRTLLWHEADVLDWVRSHATAPKTGPYNALGATIAPEGDPG